MSENIRQRKRLDESNDQSWNKDDQNGSITVDRNDDHRIRRQQTSIPFS